MLWSCAHRTLCSRYITFSFVFWKHPQRILTQSPYVMLMSHYSIPLCFWKKKYNSFFFVFAFANFFCTNLLEKNSLHNSNFKTKANDNESTKIHSKKKNKTKYLHLRRIDLKKKILLKNLSCFVSIRSMLIGNKMLTWFIFFFMLFYLVF